MLELQFSLGDSHKRVVLDGLGGVGKSQIAIEWSYRLLERDPKTWVFWVHAGTAQRFEQAYKPIAALLELPGWNDPKTDVLDLVSRWLSDINNGRWFMILDNADDVSAFISTPDKDSEHRSLPLSRYIPQTATGSVLITTRNRGTVTWLSTGYESNITVALMTPEDAKQLLLTKIPQNLSSDLEGADLVKELEYLPLAITKAAAYISARAARMTVSKYLALYRSDDRSQSRLLDGDFGDLRRDLDGNNSVIRTWQISFDQIKKTWPAAADLLSLIAMLDRQGIPDFLLSAIYESPLDFDEALTPLDQFSLIAIEKGGTSYEVHRLVQLATQKWIERHQEIEQWQGKAIELVSKAFPKGYYSNWKTCETLLPHAEKVNLTLASDTYCLPQATLLYNMAFYSWLQGRYTLARTWSQGSLSIRKRILTDNDSRILDSMAMLGLALGNQGKLDEAETLGRRVLLGREAVLGPEHHDTLMSVNNLAVALQFQGKYDEAEMLNRRVLAGYEVALGPKHPDTLTSVDNLASMLTIQGKYDEAETLNRRALAGFEVVLGPEHPDTLTSVFCLAYLLQKRERYDDASIFYRRACLGYQKHLGPNHPITVKCSVNYKAMLKEQGHSEEEF